MNTDAILAASIPNAPAPALAALIAARGPLPGGWRELRTNPAAGGKTYLVGGNNGLAVIEAVLTYGDGRRWHHVSVSKRPGAGLPTHEELLRVKDVLIGRDREAYIVFPPASRYVNEHEVLHLWHCLDAPPDGAVLPDFRVHVDGRLSI